MEQSIKKLREDAWGLQNRLSGRPGLSTAGVSLPEDVKRQVHLLCSSALSACSDFEQGYMDPDDFNDRVLRYQRKMGEIRNIMEKHEADLQNVPAVQKNVAPKSREAPVEFAVSTDSSGSLNRALEIIADASENVNLSGLKLTDTDLAHIIVPLEAKGFSLIDLSQNDIRDSGCQRLACVFASGRFGSARELILDGNSIGESGRSAIVSGLQALRKDLVIRI